MCQSRNRAGYKVFLAEAGSLGCIPEAVFFWEECFTWNIFSMPLKKNRMAVWRIFQVPAARCCVQSETDLIPASWKGDRDFRCIANKWWPEMPAFQSDDERTQNTNREREAHLAAAHMGKGFCFSACLVPSLLCRCNCTYCTGIWAFQLSAILQHLAPASHANACGLFLLSAKASGWQCVWKLKYRIRFLI